MSLQENIKKKIFVPPPESLRGGTFWLSPPELLRGGTVPYSPPVSALEYIYMIYVYIKYTYINIYI